MFETKVSEAVAQQEVENLLDLKGIFPKQRQRIAPASEAVVEAISLGLVVINADGSIKQTLFKKTSTLTEINYKARVSPTEIAQLQRQTKNADPVTARLMTHIRASASVTEAEVNELEPQDRNITEAIALFFM